MVRTDIKINIDVEGNAKKIIDSIKESLERSAKQAKKTSGEVTIASDFAKNALSTIGKVIDSVSQRFEPLKTYASNAFNTIQQHISNIKTRFGEIISTLEQMSPGFSTVAESFRTAWQTATEYVKSGLESITGMDFTELTQKVSSVTTSISSAFNSIPSVISSAIMGVASSIDGVLTSVNQKISSIGQVASGVGGAISSGLSTAKTAISAVGQSFSQLSGTMSNFMGLIGAQNFVGFTTGLSLSREKMTALATASMGADVNIKNLTSGLDEMTNNSVVSMDMMIQGMNKIKMSSGLTGEQINKLSTGIKEVNGKPFAETGSEVGKLQVLIERLGSAALLMGDDIGHAQFVMSDAMDGLNGNFKTLQMNLGITKEKVLNAGWSGSAKDVDGYVDALMKVTGELGDTSAVMDTTAGKLEVVKKNFRVAGRQIGDQFTPYIGKACDWFTQLNHDGNVGAKAVLYTYGAFSTLSGIIPLVSEMFSPFTTVIDTFKQLGGAVDILNTAQELNNITTALGGTAKNEEAVAALLDASSETADAAAKEANTAATISLTTATGALMTSMKSLAITILTSPWFWLVVAIVAVIAILWHLYNTNEDIKKSIDGIINSVKGGLINAWNTLVTVVHQVWDGLVQLGQIIWQMLAPALENIVKQAEPLLISLEGLYYALEALWDTLTGTRGASKEVADGFNYLATFGKILGAIILGIAQVVIWLVQGAFAILLPVLTAVVNILRELIHFITAVIDTLIRLYNGTIDLENAFNRIKYHLQVFGEKLWEIFVDMIGNIWNNLVPLARDIVAKIGPWVNVIIYYAKIMAMGFVNTIIDWFTGLPSAIWNILVSLGQYIYTTFSDVLGSVEDTISGWIDNVMNYFSELGSRIQTRTSTAFEGLMDIIFGIFSGDWEQIFLGLEEYFGETIGTMLEDVITQFFDFKDGINQSLWDIINSVIEFGTNLWDQITTILTQLILLPQLILTYLQQIITNVIIWGIAVVQEAYNTGMTFVMNIIIWISQLPVLIWTWLYNSILQIINWCTLMIQYAIQTGTNFVTALINYISQLPVKIWTWLWNTIQKVIQFAQQMITNMKNAAMNAINGFINEIKNLPNKVKEKLDEVIQKVKDWAKNIVDRFKQAASDAVNGFLNGLNPLKGISIGGNSTNASNFIEDLVPTVAEDMNNCSNLIEDLSPTITNQFMELSDNCSNALNNIEMNPTVFDNIPSNISAPTVNTSDTNNDVEPVEQNMSVTPQLNTEQLNSDSQLITQSMTNMSNLSTQQLTLLGLAIQNISTQSTNNLLTLTQNNLQTITNYTQMVTQINTQLTTLQTKNQLAWTNIRTKTENDLKAMLSTTKSVTQQMIQAWNTMKDSIIKAADSIKSQSETRFNSLWSTIKTFYHNIQHPGGAGTPSSGVSSIRRGNRTRPLQRVQSTISNVLGDNPEKNRKTLSYTNLKTEYNIPSNQLEYLLPTGSMTKKIPSDWIDKFLMATGGAGGWDSIVKPNTEYIRTESNKWETGSPVILGKYPLNRGFKVGEFENGTPNIDFGTFVQLAEDLFSQISYSFYMDSDKYGSWQAAAYAGAMNCSDSTDFLLAFANACGFSGSKVHGHWNSIGHFWASINGKKMDTTGWMLHRTWTPSQSHAGYPTSDPFNSIAEGMSSGNSNVDEVNHSGQIDIVLHHEISGLPDNLSKNDVNVILEEAFDDRRFIKKLVGNPDFQELDKRMKQRLVEKKGRFIG